ncbi:hypothetical protein [Frigoribacterium faeni]|uniref:hypothetical protein n=1 Tax=Frigoribacterium faeni TaxID=145483 RepID=UPI002412FD85|nr:hypothetical protein [Frigoribacterium faeni]
MLTVKGYGMDATFDGHVFVVTARNKVASGALGATERRLAIQEVIAVSYKAPSMLINGALTVQTATGLTQFHFLKKTAGDVRPLYEQLLRATGVDVNLVPTGSHLAPQGVVDLVASANESKAVRSSAKEQKFADRATEDEATKAILEAFTTGSLVSYRELGGLVPVKSAAYVRVDDRLREAAEHAAAGRVEAEEREIALALVIAKAEGGRTVRGATELRIRREEGAGLLRIGSERIGQIDAEDGFSQTARKGSMFKVASGEKRLIVRSDRVVTPNGGYPIDAYTSAQVYLDGQELITQRPTLTRMALLSPLPGSAIIPGMALQKKEKHDTRQGEFQVGGRGWAVRVMVHPDKLSVPRQMAEQINRHASAAADALPSAQLAEPALKEVSASTGTDVLSQLERLHSLIASGAITQDEATALKRTILGS